MIRLRVVLASLLAFSALTFGVASAADPSQKIHYYGLAGSSCATWLSSSEYQLGGEQWIFGFWSGLNQEAAIHNERSDVGKTTDRNGIVGEVKKVCLREPSKQLKDAAGLVFYEFQRSGR